jgi:hypothetical protein
MEAIVYQFGDVGNTLATAKNILLTTNNQYNYNYALSVNKVGYGTGSLGDNSFVYHPLEVDTYYNVGGSLEVIDVQDWTIAESTPYPFRTGDYEAFRNGKLWIAPATGSAVDDTQTLEIVFDNVSDLTSASYLAIQFGSVSGSPGLTYALKSGSDLYSIANVPDGEKVYTIVESGSIGIGAIVQYQSATISLANGAVLIPMSAMAFKETHTSDLSTVTSLVITTNRRYNYNYALKFGEIGVYTGEIGEEGMAFSKLLDLSTDKTSQFIKSGQVTNECNLGVADERTIYGDTVVSVTGTGKNSANFSVWSGGSFGSVTMVEDFYGDRAFQLVATGSNPGGDAYTAIDISQGGFSWGDRKGISFYARNDSEAEVSFNFETDCRVVASGKSDRFNIKQGYRYYLYDVNSQKTFIYMTKPTATLPVGFEGWVRIPFDAFFRADWSTNGVTKELFMSEGTIVSYLAITINASQYLNLPFTLNKVGAYSVTPTITGLWNKTGSSIPELMDL